VDWEAKKVAEEIADYRFPSGDQVSETENGGCRHTPSREHANQSNRMTSKSCYVQKSAICNLFPFDFHRTLSDVCAVLGYLKPGHISFPTMEIHMHLTYQFEQKDGYFSIFASGAYSLEDVKALIVRIFVEAEHDGVRLILLDVSGVTGDIPLMDRYEWAMVLVEQHTAHINKGYPRLKIALYGTEPLVDPGRFGEMVANNRGVDILVTDDKEKAYLWLGIPPELAIVEENTI
jgi:hypothetical protein